MFLHCLIHYSSFGALCHIPFLLLLCYDRLSHCVGLNRVYLPVVNGLITVKEICCQNCTLQQRMRWGECYLISSMEALFQLFSDFQVNLAKHFTSTYFVCCKLYYLMLALSERRLMRNIWGEILSSPSFHVPVASMRSDYWVRCWFITRLVLQPCLLPGDTLKNTVSTSFFFFFFAKAYLIEF